MELGNRLRRLLGRGFTPDPVERAKRVSAADFVCSRCGAAHPWPSFGWDYPLPVLMVPYDERDDRVRWSPDECVIDDERFFLRGCVEIPVCGADEPNTWGVWAQVSEQAFDAYCAAPDQAVPFTGVLPCVPPIYEDSEPEVAIHPRRGLRPTFRVLDTAHPMAVHQREGLDENEVRSIAERLIHRNE